MVFLGNGKGVLQELEYWGVALEMGVQFVTRKRDLGAERVSMRERERER